MPYKTIKDLPENVKSPLPPEAQRVWLRVFNSSMKSCIDRGTSEKNCETVGRIAAWVAVENGWKKNKDGKWVKNNTKKN